MKFTKRNGGFTMLEILAVLAIVLILAAILFPAIESAREKSLATACNQNVKQLVLAITQYEQDKSQFPAGRQYIDAVGAPVPVATNTVIWGNAIAPYMHADPAATSGMGDSASTVAAPITAALPPGNRDALYPDAYRCPSVSNWDRNSWNMSYGYNHQYLGDGVPRRLITGDANDRGFANFPVRKSSIVRPDRMICVADSDGTGFNAYQSAAAVAVGPNNQALGAWGFLIDPTFLPARVHDVSTPGSIPAIPLYTTTAGVGGANFSPAAGGMTIAGGAAGSAQIGIAGLGCTQAFRGIISNRHKGSANVGFLDGHVESLVRENCYFQPVPPPTVGVTLATKAIYPSNALWNGFGLDNDLDGDGVITVSVGERILDENEAYVLALVAGGGLTYARTAAVGAVYNPQAPGAGGTYTGLTGLVNTSSTWGPGFNPLSTWFNAPAPAHVGPTLPHVGPYKLEAGAVQ